MIMKKFYLLLALLITCTMHVVAQTDYYYYKGNKIPLTVNEDKVCVSIPLEFAKTIERISANVQPLITINNEDFDIFVITKSDYDIIKSMNSWEEDLKSVILTSCYFTENNEEVFATPYLTVLLNNEDDIDLLSSYAMNYKLRIVGDGPYSNNMPLYYVLSLTLESDKNTFECANEIYESGSFASSEPDLSPMNSIANNIHFVTNIKPWILFDLQGRRLNSIPQKGMYIQGGKKWMVK